MRAFIKKLAPDKFTGRHIREVVTSDEFGMWVEKVESDLDAEFSFIDTEGILYFRQREKE